MTFHDDTKPAFTELPLPTTPAQLLRELDKLSIPYDLHHHKPVFTVKQSTELDQTLPGTPCRNLFLRDKKKRNFLLTLQNNTKIDLKKLPYLLNSARLSFGSADRLWEFLGVRPGSVCPFSIINDTHKQVTLFLDQSMMETPRVNYHPLQNDMTLSLTPQDLLKFIAHCGHVAHIIDLSSAKPDVI